MLADMTAEETLLIERGRRLRTLLRPSYLEDPRLAPLAKRNPFYRGRRVVVKPVAPVQKHGSNVIAFPRARAH